MCRIFDQTDEFWLGMVTACVVRDADRRLAKIGKTNRRQKRRVEPFRLGQATDSKINMVKQPSHKPLENQIRADATAKETQAVLVASASPRAALKSPLSSGQPLLLPGAHCKGQLWLRTILYLLSPMLSGFFSIPLIYSL
jgi:hypothetical protein